MYTKPELVRFGRLRELTQLGFSHDCDGGIQGVTVSAATTAATDGEWMYCRRS